MSIATLLKERTNPMNVPTPSAPFDCGVLAILTQTQQKELESAQAKIAGLQSRKADLAQKIERIGPQIPEAEAARVVLIGDVAKGEKPESEISRQRKKIDALRGELDDSTELHQAITKAERNAEKELESVRKALTTTTQKFWRTLAAERIGTIPQPFKELVQEIVVSLELGNPASCAGPIGGHANLAALVPQFAMTEQDKAAIRQRLQKEYGLG